MALYCTFLRGRNPALETGRLNNFLIEKNDPGIHQNLRGRFVFITSISFLI